MERLTGIDTAFLAMETPNNHMHVLATVVLDPSGVEGGFDVDSMRSLVADRIGALPPLRRRLVPVPFGFHNPIWVEDPEFDLEYHVRPAALPAPGGPRELAAFTAEIASRPLNRAHPLWEMWVVEGLEHGHVAVVVKLHHAAIDGVLGVELMSQLFDLEPKAIEPWDGRLPVEPERVPPPPEMMLGAVTSFVRRPFVFLRATRNAVRSVWRVVERARNETIHSGVPLTAPETSINGKFTPHRRVAFTSVPLEDIKAVKNAFGVTVNDVVVAVVGSALRRYLDAHGGVPDRPLVAAIPTSVRTEDERGHMGNRVSAMFASLPMDTDDPVERLDSAHATMGSAKAVHEDIGAQALTQWAAVPTPAFFSQVMRWYEDYLQGRHPPIINLVLSNFPGPDFPLYCAGARMVGLYPMGPVMAGSGLNVTMTSYLDSVEIGLMACRELVPDVWEIAESFPDALAELTKAAERSAGAGGS